MTLPSLEARIAAATGPDREIDAALWLMCFEPTCAHFNVTFHTEQYDNYISREYIECDLGTMAVDQMEPPLFRYSESIDAIVALVERSGWRIYTLDASIAGRWSWMLKSRAQRLRPSSLDDTIMVMGNDYASSFAPTPALALCLALVRAEMAKEEAK